MTSELLQQEFLQKLSEEYGIEPAEASEKVDQCLKLTSIRLSIPLTKVHQVIMSETYLFSCLEDRECDELTLENCRRSCFCVEFQSASSGRSKCISRVIEDFELINRDPDKYIKTYLGRTKDLEEVVERAAYLYYNYDGGGLTDNSFDALIYHLKKRVELRGRQYEKIGAPPVEKIRTPLPYPMPSLEKMKPGEKRLLDYVIRNSVPDGEGEEGLAWSLKLDGVSGMVVYKEGMIDAIYTRGDGEIGGNITYLKEYIKTIPEAVSISNLVVRGEFILSKKLWNEKYCESYGNARSFVSGKINSGFIVPAMQDIDFVAYQMMNIGEDEDIPPLTQSLRILVGEGFLVPENGVYQSPTVFDFMNLYREKRSTSAFHIDGLVLTPNRPMPSISKIGGAGSRGGTQSIAFKMTLEEQLRNTKVLDVEWNISRYGRYKPVAIYESVYVDGVRLHRASGHNAAHIRDWYMGRGTQVVIARSGDVIPVIKDVIVDESIEPIYPLSDYAWHWQRNEIILDEIEDNRDVQIKRMTHFFVTIGVPRLREKTLEKFWEAGFHFPENIVSATPKEMIKIRGIGKKTADAHYNNIKNVMRTTPVDRFLVASTTLQVGVGRKLVKQLFRYIPNIFQMTAEEIKEEFARRKREKRGIRGFGPKRVATIAEGIPKFRDYLYSFAKEDIEETLRFHEEQRLRREEEGYNPYIKEKTFVLTGFMGNIDYELEDYIYDNMGDFSTTVTTGGKTPTEAVIAARLSDISGKMLKAADLGVPVLSIEEFAIRYHVPLKRFQK